MSAGEKIAWTQCLVSAAALVLAALLAPLFGSQIATSAFALLALIAVLAFFFLRQHGNRVVVDERDREISRRATSIGVATAWMVLVGALIVATLSSNYLEIHSVPTALLNWLIWVQFAVSYGTTGLAAVVLYRRQRHAA